MQSQIYRLAALAYIDAELDELEEEFGDLPQQVKDAEQKVHDRRALAEETEGILNDVREFRANSQETLSELKRNEDKLAKKQFHVRNNKEFDAITKEIEHIRFEYNRLTDEMRTVGVKEENLLRMLEQQKHDVTIVEAELKDKEEVLEDISSDQNEESGSLRTKRKDLVKEIESDVMEIYGRIRTLHNDACVQVRKNSCSGCFSAVPPQKIVEIRNNLNRIYYCENCGRILYPEEVIIDESVVD